MSTLLKKTIKHVHRCNLQSDKDMRHPVPLVLGRQGVGKSAIIKKVAEELEENTDDSFSFIKLQGSMLEHPADILGYPETDEEGKTKHLPHEWFHETQEYDQGILFIDEFLRTAPPAQNALYDLILWGELGQYKLSENWSILCASNPPTSEYHVEDMDPALIDRFLVFPFKGNRRDWMNWAKEEDIDDDIVGYYQQHNELVTLQEPEIPFEITPTHRSLEMLDILYEPTMDDDLLHAVITGTIGEENFESFRDYVEMSNSGITPEQVVEEYDQVRDRINDLIHPDGTVEMQVLKPIAENVVDYLESESEDLDDTSELNVYRKNLKNFLTDIPRELMETVFEDICGRVDPELVRDEELFEKLKGEVDV